MTVKITQPITRLQFTLFVLRVICLVVLAITFVPPLIAQAQMMIGNTGQQLAAHDVRIAGLEKTMPTLVQQNMALTERVSRIEGIGVGLSALLLVQLFLQAINHVSITRGKGKT